MGKLALFRIILSRIKESDTKIFLGLAFSYPVGATMLSSAQNPERSPCSSRCRGIDFQGGHLADIAPQGLLPLSMSHCSSPCSHHSLPKLLPPGLFLLIRSCMQRSSLNAGLFMLLLGLRPELWVPIALQVKSNGTYTGSCWAFQPSHAPLPRTLFWETTSSFCKAQISPMYEAYHHAPWHSGVPCSVPP